MKLITLTGATAAGAESVLADIINNNPEVKLVIPVTTRPQLENEVNGKEFTFISKEEFLDLYSENKLVEHLIHQTEKKYIGEYLLIV